MLNLFPRILWWHDPCFDQDINLSGGLRTIKEGRAMEMEEDSRTAESRRGPIWQGWVLSILVAVILSVTATLLLGGSGSFRQDRAVASGAAGGGSGSHSGRSCCPAVR